MLFCFLTPPFFITQIVIEWKNDFYSGRIQRFFFWDGFKLIPAHSPKIEIYSLICCGNILIQTTFENQKFEQNTFTSVPFSTFFFKDPNMQIKNELKNYQQIPIHYT